MRTPALPQTDLAQNGSKTAWSPHGVAQVQETRCSIRHPALEGDGKGRGDASSPDHAAAMRLPFDSIALISATGRAWLNRKPCISVQPSLASNCFCASVSTPSAVVVMLRDFAMLMTA